MPRLSGSISQHLWLRCTPWCKSAWLAVADFEELWMSKKKKHMHARQRRYTAVKKKTKQYFFCIFLYLKSKEKGEKLLPLETKSVIFTNIFLLFGIDGS